MAALSKGKPARTAPRWSFHERQETHRYPSPLSDAFWRAYAEPVEDFFKAAVQLRKALAYSMTQPTPDLRTWFGSEVVWTSCMP